jgi:shikimate dehydrogenase
MNRELIDGATKLLAVIGHPIDHSLSPQIHNSFAADRRLPYVYAAFDIEPERAEDFLRAARLLKIAGFNLTMPLKEKIIPYLDALSENAERYGAVNTVVNRDGKFYGYNTDGDGFIASLSGSGFDVSRRKALILGTGGAAKAVAIALAQKGAQVKMASRHPETLPALGCNNNSGYCHWNDLTDEVTGCSLLINATPLGMLGFKEDFSDFAFLDGLEAEALVYDLIYAPKQTQLLQKAAGKNFATMNGLFHLVYQAALSFVLFTGQNPGEESIQKIIRRIV